VNCVFIIGSFLKVFGIPASLSPDSSYHQSQFLCSTGTLDSPQSREDMRLPDVLKDLKVEEGKLIVSYK